MRRLPMKISRRFPGAPDPDAYWELLSGGVDAIREIPDDRFDVDEWLALPEI